MMRSALNEYPLFAGISGEDQKMLLPCINARLVDLPPGQCVQWLPEHTGLVLDGELVPDGELATDGKAEFCGGRSAAEADADGRGFTDARSAAEADADGRGFTDSRSVAEAEQKNSAPGFGLKPDALLLFDTPVTLTAKEHCLILKMDRHMMYSPCWFSCSFHHRLMQNANELLQYI